MGVSAPAIGIGPASREQRLGRRAQRAWGGRPHALPSGLAPRRAGRALLPAGPCVSGHSRCAAMSWEPPPLSAQRGPWTRPLPLPSSLHHHTRPDLSEFQKHREHRLSATEQPTETSGQCRMAPCTAGLLPDGAGGRRTAGLPPHHVGGRQPPPCPRPSLLRLQAGAMMRTCRWHLMSTAEPPAAGKVNELTDTHERLAHGSRRGPFRRPRPGR